MKLWHLLSGAALTVIFSCNANDGKGASAVVSEATSGEQSVPHNKKMVRGSILIPKNVKLPLNSQLTVTISELSQGGGPVAIVSRQVVTTQDKQSPFNFELPYDPADIKLGANAILSAAITTDGQLAFVPEKVEPVAKRGGTMQDLKLVLVPNKAVPAASDTASDAP